MRIGIDLMEGDTPPHVLFSAILQAAEVLDCSHTLLVIATKAVVDQSSSIFKQHDNSKFKAKIEFRTVADTIGMADDPVRAIRRKKGSSLIVGIRLLKKHHLDAFVTCGNTGALIVSSALSLPMLLGVTRPGLLTTLPTESRPVAVLDVGGNLSCKARNLIEFAYLGVAYQRALHGIKIPTVGLLNVGVESKKGTKELRQVYDFLSYQREGSSQEPLPKFMNFIGNIEGRDVFKGVVDVLVTDGFTGNVLLKTAEGTASFIFSSLFQALKNEASPMIFKNIIEESQARFNYAEYPGAIVCGIDGIVIKAHGSASAKSLFQSIICAVDYAEKNIIAQVKEHISCLNHLPK